MRRRAGKRAPLARRSAALLASNSFCCRRHPPPAGDLRCDDGLWLQLAGRPLLFCVQRGVCCPACSCACTSACPPAAGGAMPRTQRVSHVPRRPKLNRRLSTRLHVNRPFFLSPQEKLFYSLAWTPKATVQAALSGALLGCASACPRRSRSAARARRAGSAPAGCSLRLCWALPSHPRRPAASPIAAAAAPPAAGAPLALIKDLKCDDPTTQECIDYTKWGNDILASLHFSLSLFQLLPAPCSSLRLLRPMPSRPAR